MWVNGEKYVFSEHVLQKGTSLYKAFISLVQQLSDVQSPKQLRDCQKALSEFDSLWCAYEQVYVGELMVIERDARRFIYDLVSSLHSEPAFIRAVGLLNAAANVEGQGRSEFDPALMHAAAKLSPQSGKVLALK